MALSEKDLKNMARNFFEKCLIDAEWERHNVAVLMRGTSEWSVPDEMKRLREKSYQAYEDLKRRSATGDYEERHEIIAYEILQHHSVPEHEGVALTDAFCLAILRAETEAERIKLAVYSGDMQASQVTDPYFTGCRNAFTEPYDDIDWTKFSDTPYFEPGSRSRPEEEKKPNQRRRGRPLKSGFKDDEEIQYMHQLLTTTKTNSVRAAALATIKKFGYHRSKGASENAYFERLQKNTVTLKMKREIYD